jgi:hypothetical protein
MRLRAYIPLSEPLKLRGWTRSAGMVTTGSRRPSAGRRALARAPSGGPGIRPVVDRIGAVLQAPREQRTYYMYCTMHDAPREHLGTLRASLRYLLDARCRPGLDAGIGVAKFAQCHPRVL